jgi:hypothetical protein
MPTAVRPLRGSPTEAQNAERIDVIVGGTVNSVRLLLAGDRE